MENSRYSRQAILPFVGENGQEKIRNSHIVVVGCGGLGCPILLYLAAAGIGKITIIDHDVVSLSNLHRQILFDTDDIGQHKAEIAAKKLEKSYPDTQIIPITKRLDTYLAHEICVNPDLVIDGTDSFLSKYILSEICPVLFTASVAGISGYVAGFTSDIPYKIIFPTLPKQAPNCAETGVLGSFAGMIGNFLANEALKYISGHPETILYKLININADQLHFSKTSFRGYLNQIYTKLPIFKFVTLNDDLQGQIIDIREAYELEKVPLIENSLSMPLSALNLDDLLNIPDIILKCHSGRRAERLALKIALEDNFLSEIRILVPV